MVLHFYEDEIEQIAVQNINKQLRTPIEVQDIEFSLIKKFPYASLELKNLVILDGFQEDTLLQVENFSKTKCFRSIQEKVMHFKSLNYTMDLRAFLLMKKVFLTIKYGI